MFHQQHSSIKARYDDVMTPVAQTKYLPILFLRELLCSGMHTIKRGRSHKIRERVKEVMNRFIMNAFLKVHPHPLQLKNVGSLDEF